MWIRFSIMFRNSYNIFLAMMIDTFLNLQIIIIKPTKGLNYRNCVDEHISKIWRQSKNMTLKVGAVKK